MDGSTKKHMLGDKKAEVGRQKGTGFNGFQVDDFISKESQSQAGHSLRASADRHRSRASKQFIKGQIDLAWVQQACRNNATELAWYLQYKVGILGPGARIQIRPSECEKFGLGRRARQRQVARLESAGLIQADKGLGRCPIVKVIDIADS